VELEKLAAACEYRVEKMARQLGISTRQLHRMFEKEFNARPKRKIDEWRANALAKQIKGGDPVKVAATDQKFKYPSHASKFLKRVLNTSPRDLRK
jgi:methylphosphotriester-DNA--protein-cysteine methyltransferase